MSTQPRVIRANRLVELARIARDEANNHREGVTRNRLIHVATNLATTYRRCAGNPHNLDAVRAFNKRQAKK